MPQPAPFHDCPAFGVAADLHTHSTCSDGVSSPEEIVDRALACGLCGIAVTDHDTFKGMLRAQRRFRELFGAGCLPAGFSLLPGIEVSTQTDHRDVHLLVYWPDSNDVEFSNMLSSADEQRVKRGLQIAENLGADGYPVSAAALKERGLKPNRPNIARILIEHGCAPDVRWCFAHLFGPGQPYFIPRVEVSTAEAIEVALHAGGVPVIAHPAAYHVEAFIPQLAAVGLAGIEAYHTNQSPEDSKRLVRLARELGLAVTGGSDWHGDGVHGARLGGAGLNLLDFQAFSSLQPDSRCRYR